jgi:hypothetical protein
VRQVVLANDDFGVDPEIAGAAKDFDNASGGSAAATAVANEFGIDDGAIEFGDVRKALAASGLFFGGREELFAESGRDFVAGREFDFVLNARIVGDDDATAGSVAEQADDGGMSASNDANDAAFGTASARESAEARDFGDDRVAMHGVFDAVARNENIAIDVAESDVGDNKAVAILMENEATTNFVVRCGFVLRNFLGGFLGSGAPFLGRRGRLGRVAKEEATLGELLDEAAFFDFFEHLEEGAAVVLLEVEGAREVVEGDGVISKLKKTQDVIWTKGGFGRHDAGPFLGARR